MWNRRFILITGLFLLSISMYAQSIRFSNIDLNTALERARTQNKDVFIDCYAPWCVPCKRMDRVFRDPDVASLFNEQFINVKINMDDLAGRDLHLRYHVVFLPTLLIIDKNGHVKFRSEGELSIKELLGAGRTAVFGAIAANNGPESLLSDETPIHVQEQTVPVEAPDVPVEARADANPVVSKADVSEVTTESHDSEEERILYILGNTDAANPDFLYQEAYFRLQLMDGSHRESAARYLSGESDWSTEKNMRFIFDFLYHTNTKEFQYVVDHRSDFEALLGVERVNQSLNILVYNRLFSGFPRPDLKEAIQLLSYLDTEMGEKRAHQYFLNRLHTEKRYAEFETLATLYLEEIDSEDGRILHDLAVLRTQRTDGGAAALDHCIDLAQRAVRIDGQNPHFHHTLANLYYRRGMKKKALRAAKKAMSLADGQHVDNSHTIELIDRIRNM